jgi:hypothetical protein
MAEKENRAHQRATLRWPVSVELSDPVIEGVTKDISAAGAYVCCARPLALNQVFEMNIKAPDKSLNVKAEVVWTNVSEFDDKVNPQGMGVRFLYISDEDRIFISGAVKEHNTVKQEPDLMSTLEIELDDS